MINGICNKQLYSCFEIICKSQGINIDYCITNRLKITYNFILPYADVKCFFSTATHFDPVLDQNLIPCELVCLKIGTN